VDDIVHAMSIEAEVLYKLRNGEKPGRERDWGERMHLMECDAGLIAVHRNVTAKKKDFLLAGKERWSDVDLIEEFYVHEKLGTVAARCKIAKERVVVVEKEKGPGFGSVDDFCFSSTGEPVTTGTTKKKGTTIVRGKTTYGPFEYASNAMPSPDGKHLAWVVAEGGKPGKHGGMAGGKWTVMVDGEKRSEPFDHVTFVDWSPSGKLAYIANVGGETDGIYDAKGGEWFAVIDGTRYGPYASINRVYGIALEGEHFAFLASEGGKQVAVFDGTKSDPWKSVQSICWFDGKPFYQVDENSFVIDGKRTEIYDKIHAFAFGKGGRFAFFADIGDDRHLIVDGKKGPAFGQDLHSVPLFSPDGSRIAYIGQTAGKVFLDLDGERLGTDHENLAYGVVFSPDGKRFAYSVYDKGEERWIVDGETLHPNTGDLSELVFSGDSAQYALAQSMGKGKKKEVMVFVDGKPIEAFASVEHLQWAPKANCFAALASRADEQLLLRIKP
jgi:hypothetical protein